MLIVRGLLEATRKLQHQLEERGVEFRCLVFIRTDVHEHLVRRTPDRDKDTSIRLDWDDPGVFQELIRLRICASTGVDGEFPEVWQTYFASHVAAEDSFGYMLDRTLMRPRDLLKFVQRAVEVSLNRGHAKVSAEDILQAEQRYSEDMLLMIGFEIEDISPELEGSLFAFIGTASNLTRGDVEALLEVHGVPQEMLARAGELLVWFGFLGVAGAAPEDDRYAYQVQYNIPQLVEPVDAGRALFVIHPAFRTALRISA